jgi:hypothetical protein
MDLDAFVGVQLRGGFRIADVEITDEELVDALGREAAAQTTIVGRDLCLLIRAGLSETELSVTLYHEVLEAAVVACDVCPPTLVEFNEGDFEKAAQRMHQESGIATPRNLNRMLAQFGF